jgi:cysteine desulfurase
MPYLDYNATTPLDPSVLEAMLPYLVRHHGNPSSIHAEGRQTRAAVDSARDRLASILNCKSHELVFTAGGTESDNLAILGLARSRASRGRHLITSPAEHHAVLHTFEYLHKREGYDVSYLPLDSHGRVNPAELDALLRPDTALVSIMTANNETGTLQPINEISDICRAHGTPFHSDAVQSFGKETLNTARFDTFSLAAHKFHGPKGVGLLYLKAGLGVDSIQHGGAHENQRRPGTENVAAIVGMARAAELALERLASEHDRQSALRDKLWQHIQEACPRSVRNGHPSLCLANTLNVSFPGGDGESLLMNLDLAGVCASSGSACMVGSLTPSHVLLSMGVPEEYARASIRFSLGRGTTEEEIEQTGQALRKICIRL